MGVIFISSAPSNNTARHFVTLDIIAKYRVMMAVSSIVFQVITSSCKERGKMYIRILSNIKQVATGVGKTCT